MEVGVSKAQKTATTGASQYMGQLLIGRVPSMGMELFHRTWIQTQASITGIWSSLFIVMVALLQETSEFVNSQLSVRADVTLGHIPHHIQTGLIKSGDNVKSWMGGTHQDFLCICKCYEKQPKI